MYAGKGLASRGDTEAPEDFFAAMAAQFALYQSAEIGLNGNTVRSKLTHVRRLITFTGKWPWEWTAEDLSSWMNHLSEREKLSGATLRAHQVSVRSFVDYVTSPSQGWSSECEFRFDMKPAQICHEWNTSALLAKPQSIRAFTDEELRVFFECCDRISSDIALNARKGFFAAQRDATFFKVAYGWGLRRRECCNLNLEDFSEDPSAPDLGNYGLLRVQWGNRVKGSTRWRAVRSVRPWAVEALQDYIVSVRPNCGASGQDALWVTERGGRLHSRDIKNRFIGYLQEAGLPAELTLESLRASHIDQLAALSDVPESFIRGL
ncbi:tyrosine-type recombinase/integrase [Streptomyces sp. NBC_01264]|uniref:tyrosine-type recombinase/integrase n=1 Tax=Streptomyces sp. NBC_01264 TaxID=2903804 RepID=UPI00225A4364|nr:tyrosine-type recombinase/integrase [Streptomyces sp. NBC_01264]MCX4784525.1 tyrosine-type recombinase/integrase [Streptomyces sp. NBC_01264]